MENPCPSRPEVLEELLGGFGLPEEPASRVSADLVIRHPMTQRVGVAAMARTLRQQGLDAEAAGSAATVLYALEGYDLGQDLNDIRADLRVAGVDDDLAVGAVYEAARIHRRSGHPEAAVPQMPRLGTVLAAALTAYTLMISIWLVVGGV